MELEKYGVKALSHEEKKEVNGGYLGLLAWILVAGVWFLAGYAYGKDASETN